MKKRDKRKRARKKAEALDAKLASRFNRLSMVCDPPEAPPDQELAKKIA